MMTPAKSGPLSLLGRFAGRRFLTATTLLGLLLPIAATIGQQPSPPAKPQPTNRGKPSSIADYSDPKKRYVSYLRAVKANDVEAAKRCFYLADGDPAAPWT